MSLGDKDIFCTSREVGALIANAGDSPDEATMSVETTGLSEDEDRAKLWRTEGRAQ
jgi:hypothetical protein